jgi:hypothetical protein
MKLILAIVLSICLAQPSPQEQSSKVPAQPPAHAPVPGSSVTQNAATPDFSGTWVFNPAKSKHAMKVVGGSETIKIASSGTTLEFHFIKHDKEWTEWYTTDGRRRTQKAIGSSVYCSARWKKGVLITETGGRLNSIDNTFTQDTSRWSLSSDGRILTRETDEPNIIFSYDKQ